MCYTERVDTLNQKWKNKEDRTITPITEKPDRFETFIILIDSAHKCISKIKQDLCVDPSIKSVHTLWLYELLKYQGGLTSSELAEKSNIDRSLVSREIRALARGGYITIEPAEGKRGYNTRIRLTEKGLETAEKIAAAALEVQRTVGEEFKQDEIFSFYATLEKLCKNLVKFTDGAEAP